MPTDFKGFKQGGNTIPVNDTTARNGVIANTQLIKDTVGWSGKNKLPNHLVNVTGNGTVTHNADGTVTLNGTFASATTVFVLNRTDSEAKNFMKDKRIILSRGVGTTGTTFFMNKYNGATNVGTAANVQGADYSKSEPFTLDYSDFDSIAVGIFITANATFNNLKLYPMVVDADCLDLSYEPYFGSTAFPRSEQAVLGAKNLLPNAGTSTGIFTVNANKSVTVNGTGGSEFTIQPYTFDMPNGSYILSGCTENVGITIQGYNGTSWAKNIVSIKNENEKIFTIDHNGYTSIKVVLTTTATEITNETVYPMIRLATDTDPTFAPYAMTNEQLTKKVTSLGKRVALINTGNVSVPKDTDTIIGTITVPKGSHMLHAIASISIQQTAFEIAMCVSGSSAWSNSRQDCFNSVAPTIKSGGMEISRFYIESTSDQTINVMYRHNGPSELAVYPFIEVIGLKS